MALAAAGCPSGGGKASGGEGPRRGGELPAGGGASGGPNVGQASRVNRALDGYQLPAASVSGPRHADADVEAWVRHIEAVARSEGLTFDGRGAAGGIVVVGRQGSGGAMVVGLSVYKRDGRVAMQDVTRSSALDYKDGLKMRDRFLDALER